MSDVKTGGKLNPIQTGLSGILSNIEGGHFESEVEEELRGLLNQISYTGKAGELVLKIKIKPKSGHQAVEVTGEVKVKAPSPEKLSSLFFITPEGNLSRRDPRQREMFDNGNA